VFQNVECTLLRTKTDTYLALIKLSLTISMTVSYDALGFDEKERERKLWLAERLMLPSYTLFKDRISYLRRDT